jgi:tetratricopeptide (TPR) repeat protein
MFSAEEERTDTTYSGSFSGCPNMNRTLGAVLLLLSSSVIPMACSRAPSSALSSGSAQPSSSAQREALQAAWRQVRMGYDAYKKEDLDVAMSCADEALRLDPKKDPALTAKALVLRSLVYNLRKDYDRAVTEAAKAIEAKKDAPYGYFARARAYEWKEQYQKAADDLTKAIEFTPVGPEQVTFYEFRAKCYRSLGEDEKAQEDDRRAKELAK